ncbi:MAG: shikimate dehydrogenase [Candidatus Bathyarchaeota archaeon]|nr:shikimate dehydrogenase [Candidatus Bathyarchaeota archaeon]MDI9577465.1 shikimate dehydrogenase [Thermoproteota archaeon]MDT8781168.1 shikimate dehydrogenase [Candidatus Bathyarchaeota archaeon]NLD64999.1 shikimate dehydrogenase [Thermoproteota archaeon]
MIITGKTRACGVIGDPINHSLSPIIQNAAFEAVDLNFVFLAYKVKTSGLEDAVNGARALNIRGLNVTMPHKTRIIDFLDRIDLSAQIIKSVNTVLNKENLLFGFNTDGVGALRALKENGVEPKGRKVLLLGAGGAARAVAYTLAKEADELVVLNRTVKSSHNLAKLLEKTVGKKVVAGSLSISDIQRNLQDSDILINATSVGMKPKPQESPVPIKLLRRDLSVMDIVYNPIETRLIKDAKSMGAVVIGGIEMLIYQGAASFEIWTGKSAPIQVMKKAALSHLRKV